MGLRIQNNISAMNAHRNLTKSDNAMSKSLERLSSGFRINRAADDAAGLAISQSFRADIASLKVASRNTSEASSMLQVAEGAMDQIGNMLTRLKELATQASSANAGSNLDKIEAEKVKLVDEIERIAGSAEYADTKLLDGTFGEVTSTMTASADAAGALINETNGQSFTYTEGNVATGTLTFDFSSTATLGNETFTLATDGSASNITMTGGTSGDVYNGTLVDGTSLTFDTIGLTITGGAGLTTGNIDAATLLTNDTGFSTITTSSSASTGTWTVTDAGNSITLTNGTESQVVNTSDGVAQTLDFDQLGITLQLNSGFATTELNGVTFDVTNSGTSTFQVGAENETDNRISLSIGDVTTGTSGLGISTMDFSTIGGAQSALATIDTAIDTMSTKRGDIGAYMNRLSYAAANLATTIENTQAAESVIRDVDMASEMTSFTKNQILMQAGTSMLAQANMAPQGILSLIG